MLCFNNFSTWPWSSWFVLVKFHACSCIAWCCMCLGLRLHCDSSTRHRWHLQPHYLSWSVQFGPHILQELCSWRITIIKHTCGVLQCDMIQRMVKLSLWMDLRYRLRCHWCVRVSGLNFKVQIQWERGHQRWTLNMQCRSMQCKQYQDHKFRTDAGEGMSSRAFWTEG